jgi:hypothetical protein
MKNLFGVLAVLVTLTATTSASAGNGTAEQLFRDGRRLAKEGKLAEACDAFERSDQIEPRVGALLNLAACRESQGRIATAYTLFLEATLRAFFTLEVRADFASERVTALEPMLPQLTLKIDPAQAVDGLVIKRNGAILGATAWRAAAALDPASYTIEASAPNHVTWTTTQQLNVGERITVTVGPLIASTPAVAPPPPAVATIEPTPTTTDVAPVGAASTSLLPAPKPRHFAVGAAVGVSLGKVSSATNSNEDVLQDDHMPIGLRLVGNVPVPSGALRAIGSFLYTKGLNDKTDSTNTKKLFVFGLSADYVYTPRAYPHLAFAAGVGYGWDYEVRSQDQGTDTATWTTLRASPLIYRLADGAVELGIHTQLIRRGDDFGFLGLAAVDVFLL